VKKVVLCAPSRIYEDHPSGRFSYSSMVDYFARVGIPNIDMSFEGLSKIDESWQSVLYAAATRARERGVGLAACHLSFYMPDPGDRELMARFSGEQKRGIDAAALMGIPLAVTHPITKSSTEMSYGDWLLANLAYLEPIVRYAENKGIRLCVENMASKNESESDHLYGSCANNIKALAEALDCGVCFDVGHANISGFKISEQMKELKGKTEILHVHDNNGINDRHLLPFESTVDWDDVAEGIRQSEFCSVLDVEVSAWALSGDAQTRDDFGKRVVSRAQRLMALAELI